MGKLIGQQEFRRRLHLGTPDPDAIFEKAVALEKSSPSEAGLLYREILEISPEHTAAHINLGTLLYGTFDLEPARDCYLAALRIDPDYALAHFNLGNVYDELGSCKLAIDAYRKAIELVPSYADAIYNLALVYMKVGQLRKALPLWKRYAELDPSGSWHNFAVSSAQRILQNDPLSVATRKLGKAAPPQQEKKEPAAEQLQLPFSASS